MTTVGLSGRGQEGAAGRETAMITETYYFSIGYVGSFLIDGIVLYFYNVIRVISHRQVGFLSGTVLALYQVAIAVPSRYRNGLSLRVAMVQCAIGYGCCLGGGHSLVMVLAVGFQVRNNCVSVGSYVYTDMLEMMT
ncbi:MAG: hypothetical protein ACREBU_22680 [Nitrososphaera sp.]